MFSQDEVDLLTKLGLSTNQAKIYLTLIKIPQSTAYQISKSSNLDCATVYKSMPDLQKLGLAERLITHPTTFRAIPAEQGLRDLLSRNAVEQKELRRRTERLLCHIRDNWAEGTSYPSKAESSFTLLQAEENIIQKLREGIDKTQESIRIVTHQIGFSAAIQVFEDAHRRAIARGVEIQIAVEKHVVGKKPLKILQEFQANAGFKVRYFREPPEAIVLIFDGKEAMVIIFPKGIPPTDDLNKASILWSNNDTFIALAKYYFQNKWNNATSEENTR